MSCNCGGPSNCNNCCQGIPCNCPPVYTIPTVPTECGCCPNGYTYVPLYPGSSPGKVMPMCVNTSGATTLPIPCVTCVDSVPTDCVVYDAKRPIVCGSGPNFTPGTNIYGIVAGDTLTDIISKMCVTNPTVIAAILVTIGNSTQLLAGLCNLISQCGAIPGTTTPTLGTPSFTIP